MPNLVSNQTTRERCKATPPEERLVRLENAFSTLAELAKAQSERTENSERRIELLIDLASTQHVRIKECERQMEEIRQILKEGAEAQKELRELQKQNEAHLSVLSTIVAELGRRSGGNAEGPDTA
jgi:gamma-glutamyl:cysteine ligase YbdK (ATP-grasp superfamily)